MENRKINISDISENKGQIPGLPANPRQWSKADMENLEKSIKETPELLEARGCIVFPFEGKYVVLGGNMRLVACRNIGMKEIPCIVLPEDMPVDKLKEIVIKDNGSFGQWDFDALANEWDDLALSDWGINMSWDHSSNSNSSNNSDKSKNGSLNDRFIVPPFSILDSRKGYWQKRKYDVWRPLIGDMGESREDTLMKSLEIKYKDLYLKTKKHRAELGISFREYLDKYVSEEEKERAAKKTLGVGVSLFDPVLSEIICKWFTPSLGAKIFDCFAGDTQKGLVFGYCGYPFTGVELRQEQVDVNNRVLEGRDLPVAYICDDGRNVAKHFAPESQDLLFSCPPYFDIEKYSDLDNDASNQKSYADFIAILDTAFKSALTCLKNNRFAVVVVGDVRNKRTGYYYDFCGDIKRIMREGGGRLV